MDVASTEVRKTGELIFTRPAGVHKRSHNDLLPTPREPTLAKLLTITVNIN